MPTAWLTDERYFWHDTGSHGGLVRAGGWMQPYHHFDHAETKRRFKNLVEVSGLRSELDVLSPRPATVEDLLRVHDRAYVERLRSASDADGGDGGDGESPFGPGGFDIAALAAGGVITALDWVLAEAGRNAFALVRPPGHHAQRSIGQGFCLVNNVAAAIAHARSQGLVDKVAVVDWDAHHGNGTQQIFEAEPNVLTISLHQQDLFPLDSGRVGERGVGPGKGSVVNIPLPAGSGHGAYLHAFDTVVEPALHKFAPDLIVVSSGFDAGAYDPLARMMLHSDSFREMTSRVLSAARSLCDGRLVVVQEGGYSAVHLPFCGLAVVEELAGRRTEVVDPYLEASLTGPGNALEEHQARSIELARRSWADQ